VAAKKRAILFGAHKLMPEQFIMSDELRDNGGPNHDALHPRQRRSNSTQRRQLFIEMASFTDKNGSSACMSAGTLGKRMGCHRRTVYRLQGDLLLMGWIVNRGKSHQYQGTNIWDLTLTPTPPIEPNPNSNGDKLDSSMVTNSSVNGDKLKPNDDKVEPSLVTKSNVEPSSLSHNLPKDICLKKSAHKDICPPTNLPGGMDGRQAAQIAESKPSRQEWRKEFQLEVQKIASRKDGVVFQIPLPEMVFDYVEQLTQETGCPSGAAQRVVTEWLDDRNFDGLTNPNVVWGKMREEIAGYEDDVRDTDWNAAQRKADTRMAQIRAELKS